MHGRRIFWDTNQKCHSPATFELRQDSLDCNLQRKVYEPWPPPDCISDSERLNGWRKRLLFAEYSLRLVSAVAFMVSAHSYTTCTLCTLVHIYGSWQHSILCALRGTRSCNMYHYYLPHTFPYDRDRVRVSLQFILIIGATACSIRFVFFVCFGESNQFGLLRARAHSKLYDCYDRLRSTHNRNAAVYLCPWKIDVWPYLLCVLRIRLLQIVFDGVESQIDPCKWWTKCETAARRTDARSTVDSECSPRRPAIHRHIDC